MPLVYDRYRHSPASGNMFLAAPDAFVWRYGLKNWSDEDSPRQAMGSAAEFATAQALIHGMTDDEAADLAVAEFDKRMSGVVSEEREHVAAITRKFLEKMRPDGAPLTYQHAITLNGALYGLRRDIVVKLDFTYAEFVRDTKATLRMPSEIKPDHARQMAAYSIATGKPVRVLYATPKRVEEYEATDIDKHWRRLVAAWRRIEALDALVRSPEHAIEIIPLNTDSIYWDETALAKAETVWRI